MTDPGLADVIEGHACRTPHKTALHFAGQDISYGQLWQRVESTAVALAMQGVNPGDRVAWLGLNDPAQLVLLFALARLGAILLPLNYRLAQAELIAVLDHADASLIVSDEVHAARAIELATQSGAPRVDAKRITSPLKPARQAQTEWMGDPAVLPVLLVYTSGTTGKPKGALHTQAGLLANCVISGNAHAFTSEDHVLTVLPLFHVGGLCIQTLPALYVGAMVTLHPRFDAGAWLADVQGRQPSVSLLVPATLRAVLGHAAFAATDLSSLRLLNVGSSSIPASQITAFHARGVPVCQVYGATETGPVSIYLQRAHAMTHVGSAGRAGLDVEVRLVDSEGGDVAMDAIGEILIRAPNVMCHYWNDPANPAFQHGWFHTGDLARRDGDGFYWVVGRCKDMIISGGENIYPAEIENLLADCPLILEAAVIGQPDAQWGEVAVAVVVVKPDASLNAAAIMALFDGKLARFKQPRRVIFVKALPKTALGKVQKAELADWCLRQ